MNIKRYRYILVLLSLQVIAFVGKAQQVIQGRVLADKDQSPLPGALIQILDAKIMALSDNEGYFKLNLPDGQYRLRIQYMGYKSKTQDIAIPLKTELRILLTADDNSLDEVQVIGYGESSKRLNTGSVSTLKADVIGKQPVTNVLSALSGRMAGVYVQTTNGLPGGNINVQIRGKGSLTAGTDPLYIVDGVPFVSGSLVSNTVLGSGINGAISAFNAINPQDIESINILKDADATAIYGSRGANGVVLITTKKGKAGKVKVDLNFSQGVSQVANLPQLLDLDQYLNMRQAAFRNDGLIPSAEPTSTAYAPDLMVWDKSQSTNWAKYMMGGTGASSDMQVGVTGGSTSTRFSLAANYHNEGTVLAGDGRYKRSGLRFNVSHGSADDKFSLNMSAIYNADNNRMANPASVMSVSLLLPPNFPLYDTNGGLNWAMGSNPLAALRNTTKSVADNIILNTALQYRLLPNLRFKAGLGLNNLQLKQQIINPKAALNPNFTAVSSTYFGNQNNQTLIAEPQLDFVQSFRNAKLSVLAGATWQSSLREGETIIASNFSSESLLENIGSAVTFNPSNTYIQYKYASVFGRVGYQFKDKYLFNASVRRDGSSRFGQQNQYGTFGAVGLAWVFSKEKWLSNNLPFLSYGKLRASYGLTGSDQIADYQYLPTYRSSGLTYQNQGGLTPAKIANAQFKWESNKKAELGLELGMFKDRVLITVNAYQNRSGNQLVNYALPYMSGFGSYVANLPALVENRGLELELSSKTIVHKNFSWTSNFNITFNENRLRNFPNLASSAYANIYVLGESIMRAYGYRYLGPDPQTGVQLYKLKSGGTTSTPTFENFAFTLGDRSPAWYGGLGNAFSYKQFTLDVFTQFSKQQMQGGLVTPGRLSNNFVSVLNAWQQPGDDTMVPKASTKTNSYYALSSANFFDASYLRLKNVSLAYSFSPKLLQKFKLNQIRVYAQGQNLVTLWDRDAALYDPESGAGSNLPPLRTFMMGFQITL